MKIQHFVNSITTFLVLSLSLITYPIGSHAGLVDIHFVELGEGGINANVFFSGVFSGPAHPPDFTIFFPGESASISATPALHIGNRFGVPLVLNVLEVSGGAISDQISVTTGSTIISFLSEGPGSPPFSTAAPAFEVVEDGTDRFVGSYTSGDGNTVNLFVQSDVESIPVPVPATLALLILGLFGIGFCRWKAM